MPFDGSGQFDALASPQFPAVADDIIYASRFNAVIQDLMDGLSLCVTRGGQSPLTGNVPAAGNTLTGLRASSAAGEPIAHNQTGAVLRGLTITESLTISAPAISITSSPAISGTWDFGPGTIRVPARSLGASGRDAASLDFVIASVTAATSAAPTVEQSIAALAILTHLGA